MHYFKTLKHKTLPDVFGVISDHSSDDSKEILQSSIPTLQPMTATPENMLEYWKSNNMLELIETFKDYDLVEVELFFNK